MSRKTRGRTSEPIIRAARSNRREVTPAEAKLWEALRDRKVAGLKFRRQHPIGVYVLDFFCLEKMLAIEVDGGIHALPNQAERDRERTCQLNEQGIRVLRFTNEQILQNLEAVITEIALFAQPDNPKSMI